MVAEEVSLAHGFDAAFGGDVQQLTDVSHRFIQGRRHSRTNLLHPYRCSTAFVFS